MNRMSRADERKVVLRFCLTTAGLLACVFGWLCILSFNTADPPSTSVWPANNPPANLCGPTGAVIAYYLFWYLGVGAYALMALGTIVVLAWARGFLLSDLWFRLVGMLMVCTVVSGWGTLLLAASDHWLLSGPGGVLGLVAAQTGAKFFKLAGTHVIFACAFVVGMLLAGDEFVVRFFRGLSWTSKRSVPVLARGSSAVASAGASLAAGMADGVIQLGYRLGGNGHTRPAPAVDAAKRRMVEKHGTEEDERADAAEREARERRRSESLAIPPTQFTFDRKPEHAGKRPDPDDMQPQPAVATEPQSASAPAAPSAARSRPAAAPAVRTLTETAALAGKPAALPAIKPPEESNYKLPPPSLLEPAPPVDKDSIELLCREKAYILEQTLNEFKLEVQVVAIETGPVITVFELKLAPGIKVSQIASLTNDMARALKAPAVRVVAPLPGKNTIGIEVPNIDKEKVRIRDVIELFGRRAESMAIALFLGKDAAGQPLVSDLSRMPHLLIAGTTGSGKSVCVSSIIMSILMTRSPAEVQLILVDPKVVELAMYKDVPHLMCPIVTEMAKAEAILDWAATKMDERYALLAEAGVKDIRGYNRLGRAGLKQRLDIASDEEMQRIPAYMPHIIIMIDELADLMMTAAKEVEFYLCRLAQKSRAVGIHLIVSTQRPQANVVTGLIKSNLPCRVAFRVASRLDSRIVLDQNGGEVLMGQGDMLFLPPGSSKLIRAQGTFVADDELRAVVKHCREQQPQVFHPELTRMPGGEATAAGERDELFDQAVEITLESGRGSVSLLQRRLTIGYGRASRLIDQMYAAGIVGEYKGSQAREVIISKEEWDGMRTMRDREEAAEDAKPSAEA
jgi:S-DNA-T family DNA segregation ATPase FtsK/SpoIIIE